MLLDFLRCLTISLDFIGIVVILAMNVRYSRMIKFGYKTPMEPHVRLISLSHALLLLVDSRMIYDRLSHEQMSVILPASLVAIVLAIVALATMMTHLHGRYRGLASEKARGPL